MQDIGQGQVELCLLEPGTARHSAEKTHHALIKADASGVSNMILRGIYGNLWQLMITHGNLRQPNSTPMGPVTKQLTREGFFAFTIDI